MACILLWQPLARAQDDAAASEARAAFQAGQAAYAAGRFPAALTYFERAYELTEEPDILYNIATVHDRLRHDREALEAYRGYLAGRPEAEDRANVEARIRALEGTLAEAEAQAAAAAAARAEAEAEAEAHAAVPVAEPTAAEPTTRTVQRDAGPGPWALIGIGGAAAITGGVLVGLAFADIDAVESGAPRPWGEVSDAAERAPILSGVGFAAIGVGVAAVIGGVVWAAVGGGEEQIEVGLGPGGVRLRGRL